MGALNRKVSAADANRKFSELLRQVRGGGSFVVTSHGKPVAKLVPIDARDNTVRGARGVLLDRLKRAPVTNVGRWKRDELYED
jgi:prevent-host-death family protein